jgi:ubiquitin C-terminal hydrolase
MAATPPLPSHPHPLRHCQTDCNRVRAKPQYRELPSTGSEAEQAEAARAYQLSWHNSLVEDLFVGQLQSTVTCAGCGGTSHCFDPFYSLALPLPARKGGGPVPLQELLAAFVQSEDLQDSERYRCGKCGPSQPATKRLQVWAYPPAALVLTLKRFSSTGASAGWGGGGGGSFNGRFSAARKVATPVGLPPGGLLDLAPYCNPRGLKECLARGCPAPVYRLVAIANHSGTLGGGARARRGLGARRVA